MEHSSPLAAMQPPPVVFGHCFRSEATSFAAFPPVRTFGPNNFKDIAMKRAHADYFSMKPVRGSSPTASLAADLSQNFHIDKRYVVSMFRMIPVVTNADSLIAPN
jgi:M-phase inducer tyrosine phosphatase